MIKPHATRKELNAPEYLVAEWNSGDRNALADLLRKVNFDKDCMMFIILSVIPPGFGNVVFSSHKSLEVA